MRSILCLLAAVWLAFSGTASAEPVDVGPLLKTLQSVGPKGAGHREATGAWQRLARADAERLPAILAGLDGANPLAANWIRTAVDAIAQHRLQEGGKLPAAELEAFLADTRHAPRARRLAYEWLLCVDPAARQRLIPGMLDDPSVEMRRDAVAWLIGQAVQVEELRDRAAAAPTYRRALDAARDPDQVKLLTQRLRSVGQEVDLARHFGYLVRWKLIGPFDNTGEKGYPVAYPPEREIDFTASYKGKHGTVRWIDHVTTHDYGRVDLNKAIGEEKGVIAYAATEFLSSKRQQVELRAASFNALKWWINGTPAGEFPVYHGGREMDQYVTRSVLKAGRNLILVKVCQNEQTQSWARFWDFQLRVCDASGGAILSTDRDEKPPEKPGEKPALSGNQANPTDEQSSSDE